MGGVLVFASKRVGLETVEYLLDKQAPVARVIAGIDADQPIVEMAVARSIPAEVYGRQTQRALVAAGERYDWLLNLWCPHILRRPVLQLADRRLNIHPSLVPHCQGNDNAAWCIRKGLPAGVSLIEMEEQVDVGGVYAQKEVPYVFPIRGKELHEILQREAITLFEESWPAICLGTVAPRPQTGPGSYHTRRQTEGDRVVDADAAMSVDAFLHWVLAHDFHPRTTAECRYQGKTYKLRLTMEEKSVK